MKCFSGIRDWLSIYKSGRFLKIKTSIGFVQYIGFVSIVLLLNINLPMQQISTHATLQAESQRRQTIYLTPYSITKVLVAIIFSLLLANLASIYYENYAGIESNSLSSLSRSFDFNEEHNVPTFFSSVILLMAAGLLFLIYALRKHDKADGRKWQLLGLVFLFMAIDETVQIHEFLADVVRPRLPTDLRGLLYWAWVVPYGLLALAVAAYFISFVLRLPALTRNLFLLSGFMFVSGAIGLELFEGYFYKLYGLNHIYNKVLYCTEELLEMSAVVVFIYALLDYLSSVKPQVYITKEAERYDVSARRAGEAAITGEVHLPEEERAADI
jgi:hypothetical protein